MYLSFYHLKHKPFQISTDPRFLWLGEKHEEALATLEYGVLDNRGFLLLTGDVGTGKTTLINALLHKQDKNTLAAFIRDPALDPLDFFQYTAHAFGMKASSINTKGSFLIQFEEFLLNAYESRRKVILIIDEAQRMSQQLLEEVRLLSNLERDESKLLNIFFVGQLEFNDLLHLEENRAIRQRITLNYNIETLTEKETKEYISHRLKVASTDENVGFFAPIQRGEDGEITRHSFQLPLPEVENKIFTEEAIGEIYQFSQGCPRLINVICDRALLTGFVEGAATITALHIEECVKELEIPHQGGSFSRRHEEKPHFPEASRAVGQVQQAKTPAEPTAYLPPDVLTMHQSHAADRIDSMHAHRDKQESGTVSNNNLLEERIKDENDSDDTVLGSGLETVKPDESYIEESDEDSIGEKSTREMVDELARLVKYADELAGKHSTKDNPAVISEKKKPVSKAKRIQETIIYACAAVIFAAGVFSMYESGRRVEEYQHVAEKEIENVEKAVSENVDRKSAVSSVGSGDLNGPKKQKLFANVSKFDDSLRILEKKEKIKTAKVTLIEPVLKVDPLPAVPSAPQKTSVLATSHKKPPPVREPLFTGDIHGSDIRQAVNQFETEKIKITFAAGSMLPGVESLKSLNSLVDSLSDIPSYTVLVVYFFNDSDGPELRDYQQELHAHIVKSYLMGRGVDESRIILKKISTPLPSNGEGAVSEAYDSSLEILVTI